jgi:poly-gamma-glutamate synthesis protein (capsule biosynthesis protein)
MRSFYFILFIAAAVIFYWVLNPYYVSKEPPAAEKDEKVDSVIFVNFSAVGDVMCHSTQYYYAWVEKDSFDFDPVFSIIGDYLRDRDIMIGNLETVLAGDTKNYSGYPYFNTPNQLADALKNAGFDFLTTANNHANDQGFEGVKRTLEYLRKVNIIPLGTSALDSSMNYNVFVRKGLKFGMLAYTYGTNYKENSFYPRKYVNHIDTLKIKNDIRKLKSEKTDIILILFHFGEQYEKNISAYQKKIVDKTIEYGADIIIGSHPHVIQQFEMFKTSGGNLDSGFVAYSLGNFLSNQRWRYSDGGIILNFEIAKNIFTDSVYISDISYLPIWVFKGKTNRGKEYIVIPSHKYDKPDDYNFLTEADTDSMKNSYFDNIKQFTSKSSAPKLDYLD